MILQTKQKKALLETLNEKTSPFTDTKTQKIFKNTANLTLKGSTYDAVHLDSFLTSVYGSKVNGHQTSTYGGNSVNLLTAHANSLIGGSHSRTSKKTYTMSSSVVRPSIAFVSMDRDHPTQQTYVDIYDGPNSLQKRDFIPTLKERIEGAPLHYETERERHVNELKSRAIPQLKEAQYKLTVDNGLLKTPKERREELVEIKQKLEMYNSIKTQHNFFGKRDRVFKGGWRHGIFGVEDADAHNSSIFYKEQNDHKAHQMREKEAINNYRKKHLNIGLATSEQVEFCSTDVERRRTTIHKQPEPVIDIRETWRQKGRSPLFAPILTVESTKERLFKIPKADAPETERPKLNLARATKLRDEDMKGKRYNILNGQYEGHEKWYVPLQKLTQGIQQSPKREPLSL